MEFSRIKYTEKINNNLYIVGLNRVDMHTISTNFIKNRGVKQPLRSSSNI